MDDRQRFWAYDWLDAHGVKSVTTAEEALANRSSVEQVREFAERAKGRESATSEDAYSLVAGRGLDLSGHLDCNGSQCRTRQVDELFRHAWHYFDRILVADGMSHEVSMHWDAPLDDRRKWLLSHIEVLLYLREIGAEDLVVFREKPAPCERHWEKHAEDVGLGPVLAAREQLVEDLLREARIETEEKPDGSIDFVFIHPKFEHTVWGSVHPVGWFNRSPDAVRRGAVLAVLRRYTAHLTSDIATTKKYEVPLGSTIWLHGKLLKELTRQTCPDEVAFQLDLPVLRGLPVKTLLKIRSDERDAFLRFRNRLRQAISERIKTAGSFGASKLAAEIRRDLIEPELDAIRQRLSSAERMLGKKAAVGVALGSLVTVCGLLAGVAAPLAATAGIGTLTTVVGAAAGKDIEEHRELSLADMYFLWKALQHRPHDGGA